MVLLVKLATKFDTPGMAVASVDDKDSANPAVEVDCATDGSLVGAVAVSV